MQLRPATFGTPSSAGRENPGACQPDRIPFRWERPEISRPELWSPPDARPLRGVTTARPPSLFAYAWEETVLWALSGCWVRAGGMAKRDERDAEGEREAGADLEGLRREPARRDRPPAMI